MRLLIPIKYSSRSNLPAARGMLRKKGASSGGHRPVASWEAVSDACPLWPPECSRHEHGAPSGPCWALRCIRKRPAATLTAAGGQDTTGRCRPHPPSGQEPPPPPAPRARKPEPGKYFSIPGHTFTPNRPKTGRGWEVLIAGQEEYLTGQISPLWRLLYTTRSCRKDPA